MKDGLSVTASLPIDRQQATLVGRAWVPARGGPSVVVVRGDTVHDASTVAPTLRDLFELDDPVTSLRHASKLEALGTLADIVANSWEPTRDGQRPWLLAPCDLQAIKAAGVTFVASMLERVVEEHARGDAAKSDSIRRSLVSVVGDNLAVRPGSDEAKRVKEVLIAQGVWSQYLEVGIGPDAEIFTKAQPMSAVGLGAQIGLHPQSSWNNPEPEIVLAVDSRGRTLGATLGNDVNLRDFEGRSALLLPKAKDNNASCAIGPFIRLFDDDFDIADVRRCELAMRVEGPDGFVLDGASSMRQISRDPLDLVAQAVDPNHQYPDGMVLFLGTMFAPTQDRFAPGEGFTHMVGDVVSITTPRLGALVNRVDHSDKLPPWTFGTGALMRHLAARGLLDVRG
ncbi:MAG: fumarylacetoacetate hydrolase family protein [Casimicrobiaceae bacterium]